LQKVRSGKLVIPPPLLNNFPGEVQREGWKILPIGLHEAIRAATIASAHRDPFDRLLAAQAETHDLILLTTDSFFQEAGFRALW
jgi:PIN domain nuclease of toxin-antitoxin system